MTNDDIRAGESLESRAGVPIAAPATAIDAAGRNVLAVDIFCIQCGYNLRGLARSTVCPECGSDIERSLQGHWLRFAEPRWLQWLRIGTLLWLVRTLLAISATVFPIIVGLLFGAAFPSWLICASYARLLFVILALLSLTVKEPVYSLTREPSSLRVVLRCSAVLIPSLLLLRWGVDRLAVGPVASGFVEFIQWVVWAVTQCGVLVLFRLLAFRIPSRPLAKATTPAIWISAIVCGLLAFLCWYAVTTWTPARAGAASSPVYTGLGCMQFILTAVDVWIVVLLIIYYRKLTAELAKARSFAARESTDAGTGADKRTTTAAAATVSKATQLHDRDRPWDND